MHHVHRFLVASMLGLGCAGSPAAPPDPAAATATAVPTATTPPVVASAHAVEDLQVAFKQAIHRVGPAVVSVYSTKTVELRRPQLPFGEPFELFGQPPGQLEQRGLGSGFVIDADGHVLTNNHVVDGAQDIRVRFADGKELVAELVATDRSSDIAVLKIDPTGIQPAELGSSEALEVGDWVLAIGSPFGLSQTVSAGIVSAVGRANVGILDYEDFIQTDAAVNMGNSGGPLVDLGGRVIGINTAIASRGGGSNGVAFAVPIDMAKSVVKQLLAHGKVSRGQLGVVISELSPELAKSFGYSGAGILVQDVRPGSAAARAGVRSGDIITARDGEAVGEVAHFRNTIARTEPGTKVRLDLWRSGAATSVQVELDALESDDSAGIAAAKPASLGLGLENITPQLQQRLGLTQSSGVVITRVEPGSPAAKAGIAPGDVIEQVGDTAVTDAGQAAKLLRERGAEAVRLRLRRGDSGRFVVLSTK